MIPDFGQLITLERADIDAVQSAPDLEHVGADIVVHAPITGTVTQRQISPGQNIVGSVASAGAANAIYTIGDLTHLWMLANAREAYELFDTQTTGKGIFVFD